jgi:outer membrane immunogenic protein
MRKSTAAAAVALAVSIPSLAYADGMPASRGTAPTPPFTWSGFYAGINLGYGWNEDDRDINFRNNLGVRFGTDGVRPEGGFGGGQIGYNWQSGPWVLGVETDIQGADINTGANNRFFDLTDRLNIHRDIDWFGTVRGRVGYAVDSHALIYMTGGFAYGGVRDRLLVFGNTSPLRTNLHTDDTETGYTIGGGVEFAFDSRWSVKLEYQYIDLGSESLTAPTLPANGTIISSNRINDQVDTIRIGLNYRFSSGGYGYGPFR